MSRILIALTLLILTNSCLYRMPDEGEVNVIPATNNRDLTRQKGQEWTPGVDY